MAIFRFSTTLTQTPAQQPALYQNHVEHHVTLTISFKNAKALAILSVCIGVFSDTLAYKQF